MYILEFKRGRPKGAKDKKPRKRKSSSDILANRQSKKFIKSGVGKGNLFQQLGDDFGSDRVGVQNSYITREVMKQQGWDNLVAAKEAKRQFEIGKNINLAYRRKKRAELFT